MRALAVAVSPALRRAFHPAAVTLEMVAKIALAPLFASRFGFGCLPELVIVFPVRVLPILSNGVSAFPSLPPELGR
ncbi:MAG: hypothetical protein K6T74_09670 [Geminicoccaceae bacterium]|nr:hypothetical protein [Geminicoccaceae bacterium]